MADEQIVNTLPADVDPANVQSPEVQKQEPASTAEPNVQGSQTAEPTTPQINEFEIDGVGKVKADEIKEWKLGHMRQSDYTRKTQELAKQREEAKDAIELFNYLKNNPAIAQQLQQGNFGVIAQDANLATMLNNQNNPVLDQVQLELANIKLDAEIARLKSEHSDFNEVEVLNEADRLGVTDLEFVYNALQGRKLPTLKSELEKQIKSTITEEIRKNGIATQTIVNTGDVPPTNTDYGLSPEELRIATKMGLSPERYAAGKQ